MSRQLQASTDQALRSKQHQASENKCSFSSATLLTHTGALQAAGTVSPAVPSSPIMRYQFAHGCLKGHMLAGEESFAVEWDKESDAVW